MNVKTKKIDTFLNSVVPYIRNPTVQQMDQFTHHTKKISCLDHSMFVSYVSFVLAKRFHGNVPPSSKRVCYTIYICATGKICK